MAQDADREQYRLIEQEARRGRTFSLSDAVGRKSSGFLSGGSPVPRLQQVQAELTRIIADNLEDNSGALRAVLTRHINTNDVVVGDYFDTPIDALVMIIDNLLASEVRYHDFVHEVDSEWGRLMYERPYFQSPGEEPHEDDEYTHDSVRKDLLALRSIVANMQRDSET